MFKRLLWMTIGIGIGFGTSVWLMRFVRATIDRYRPERVADDLAGALRRRGADLREALGEGRQAMREREAELRAQMEAR